MDLKWNIRSIYMYVVSFATLMMILIGTINGLDAVFDYLFRPSDLYVPYGLEFKLNAIDTDNQNKAEQFSLEKERMEKSARYDVQRRIFSSAAMIGVGLPVYLYHWRKINSKENIE